MLEKAPAFQFYAADYLAESAVLLLTTAQEGIYIRLLSHCWREGSIPAEPAIAMKFCKRDAKKKDVELVLKSCFIPTGGGTRLINPKLEEERTKQAARRQKASEAGTTSATKRQQKLNSGPTTVESELRPSSPRVRPKSNTSSSSSSSSSYDFNTPIPPLGNGNGWELKDHDLRDTGKILAWMRHTRLVEDTHANELKVLAASERAFSVEKLGGEKPENRCAYFVSIVRDRNWKVITDADMDRAKMRHLTWQRQQVQAESPVDLENLFAGVD